MNKHYYNVNRNITSLDTELIKLIKLDNYNIKDFIPWYLDRVKDLEEQLLTFGSLKFRGVQINSVEDFNELTNSIGTKFINYVDGNSPRTKLSSNVYTSTEYHASKKITMHNELSYSYKWPSKLYFTCLTVPENGGETLLADSRKIYRNMDKAIVEKIEKNGILYIRNLHSGTGIGPTWQSTFETDNKSKVELLCKRQNIKYKWTANGGLQLIQFSSGIISHPKTKEKVWFNQIDQFHPYHLGEDLYESMSILFEKVEDYPMYVKFGDGTSIEESMVRTILNTIEQYTIAPLWSKNEFLLVDNLLTCHGRNPYTGDRKVLVTMSE